LVGSSRPILACEGQTGAALEKSALTRYGRATAMKVVQDVATFSNTIDSPWTAMTPVTAGDAPRGLGTPSIYVLVARCGEPVLRVDLYEREPAHYAFQEALAWGDLIVIGFGCRVHLVWRAERRVATFPLSGYFGHLYALHDRLLVADAERLHCFDRSGSLLWRSAGLGIDGVVVGNVAGGIIEGEGEWDPPGGWEPFRILLSSGDLVA
jgi:hypothetical protein